MEHITTVDKFSYPAKKLPHYRDQISRMSELANIYNFDDQHIRLFFLGDEKSGVRFRVDCADPDTRERVEYVLRQYIQQINRSF